MKQWTTIHRKFIGKSPCDDRNYNQIELAQPCKPCGAISSNPPNPLPFGAGEIQRRQRVKLIHITWTLYILLIIYSALDALHTSAFIEFGLKEANPWVNYFITKFGTLPGLFIVKAPAFLLLGILIPKFNK